ncbi:MAG: polysaccharide biosynthesis/export family protein [Desulfobacteraceae bacterium]
MRNKQLSRRMKLIVVGGILFLGISLFWGCAGPAPQTRVEMVQEAESALGNKQPLQKIFAAGFQASPQDSSDYQVGSEDLLEVNVYGQEELNRIVRVNARGEISLPLVGVVPVEGRNPLEIEKMVERLYGEKYLRNPHVTVFVKEYRHQQVAVVGAVNKPGSYEMIGPRSLLEMISQAGGLRDEAGDVVHIIRHGSAAGGKKGKQTPETIAVDLRYLLTKGDLEILKIPINHGDVISVPFVGFAYVTGEVNKPGKVPIKQGLTVTQAIALAGDLNKDLAAGGDAQILRFNVQGQREVIPVNLYALADGKDNDITLRENDIVVIPSSAGKRFWSGIKNLFRGAVSFGYYVHP